MAEASIFGLASRILSMFDSMTLKVALERAAGTTLKQEDLREAAEAVEKVKPYLLDAERREGSSEEIKNWIKTVREALYDADDLLEDVLANDFKASGGRGRRRRMKQYLKKVAFPSSLNSSVVAGIKAQLVEAFNKIEQFGLEKQDEEEPSQLPLNNAEPNQLPPTDAEPSQLPPTDAEPSRLPPTTTEPNQLPPTTAEPSQLRPTTAEPSQLPPTDAEPSQLPPSDAEPSQLPPADAEPSQLPPTAAGAEPKEDNISIREEDRKAILKYLLTDDGTKSVPLVIIHGSRGMGKTTIAQLVCKNEEVQKKYETVWWASMSDSLDEKEIYQRILQSMIGKSSDSKSTLPLLKAKVRGCMFSAKSFLLVLDDIWAQDFDRFMRIRPLLMIVPKGSKIMVTSKRFLDISDSDCIEVETRRLDKLSVDDSKKLLAWYSENESVGGKTMEACEHVPLAMKSLSSLYHRNPDSLTIESLSKINVSDDRQRAPLMFSYEHLKQDLKNCFAYCSLFPDDYTIHKRELVRLWVAQGYLRSEVEEVTGDSYFKQLLDMSFFQEPKEDDLGNMFCCRIHDLVHDVARAVGGKQYTTLMKKEGGEEQANQPSNELLRHMAVGYEIDASWKFPLELLREDRLRSILFLGGGVTLSPGVFDKILSKFKRLRALSLGNLNLSKVPSSIGELHMLRYLNLSRNNFKRLPDSITYLFNLLTLDITGCSKLQVLPESFSGLNNLIHLYNSECHSLRHMPPGIEKMTALQELGCFKVRKTVDNSECSRIDALGELKLTKAGIWFDHDCKQESVPLHSLPGTLQVLRIEYYRGINLPYLQSNLVELHLYNCASVKVLSSLGCLKLLKNLVLLWMDDLEHIVSRDCPATLIFSVLSNLEKLVLRGLPKFIGWPRDNVECRFTRLSFLKVEECPELKYIPPSPRLKTLSLRAAVAKLTDELLSSSSSLEDVTVDDCDKWSCFKGGELKSLRRLKLSNCTSLKTVQLPPSSPDLVIEKKIRNCPNLQLKEKEDAGPAKT